MFSFNILLLLLIDLLLMMMMKQMMTLSILLFHALVFPFDIPSSMLRIGTILDSE